MVPFFEFKSLIETFSKGILSFAFNTVPFITFDCTFLAAVCAKTGFCNKQNNRQAPKIMIGLIFI